MHVRRAVGPTKKKAEQDAARQILEHLHAEPGNAERGKAERPSPERTVQESAKVVE
jgi:hypothetical protein